MTRLQFTLQRACDKLQLQLVAPFSITVQQCRINAQALLPQLGSPNGMIVVGRYEDLSGKADEIVAMGYGYSVLDEPLSGEELDIDCFVEMFSDWGWGKKDEKKPAWMD